MEDKLTYLSVQDSSRPFKDGFNEANKIALWSKNGKTLVTSQMLADFVNDVGFDLIECPYDDHNFPAESKKRNRKAFDRTKHFIDAFFGENSQIKVLYI